MHSKIPTSNVPYIHPQKSIFFKGSWMISVGDIRIFFILYQVNFVEMLVLSRASFFTLESLLGRPMLMAAFFFRYQKKANQQEKLCAILDPRLSSLDLRSLGQDLVKTCEDLGLDSRRAKSKKWHGQSSDTVLIQDLQFHRINTD